MDDTESCAKAMLSTTLQMYFEMRVSSANEGGKAVIWFCGKGAHLFSSQEGLPTFCSASQRPSHGLGQIRSALLLWHVEDGVVEYLPENR